MRVIFQQPEQNFFFHVVKKNVVICLVGFFFIATDSDASFFLCTED